MLTAMDDGFALRGVAVRRDGRVTEIRDPETTAFLRVDWAPPPAGPGLEQAAADTVVATRRFVRRQRSWFRRDRRIRWLDGADPQLVPAALSAVTEHIGLAATLTTTYHEPLEVARQLATLDHLSGGRAAWNLVTSTDAVSGANFRRGAYLPYDGRYDAGYGTYEPQQQYPPQAPYARPDDRTQRYDPRDQRGQWR